MISRRRFCGSLLAGGLLAPLCVYAEQLEKNVTAGFGALRPDPREILDLPAGFSYQILSVMRQQMSDGLVVPGWPDGMHAFADGRDRIVILCNHELDVVQQELSGWHLKRDATPRESGLIYDTLGDSPAPGGVRRMVYNLRQQKLEQQYMVLSGTLRNCSGGATPWNSWISCEESVMHAGQSGLKKDHGYCFEVSANASGLTKAVPLTAMGRFNHEAAAVDPATGIIYLTEDRVDGLFYRFIPRESGKLQQGGKLQALALGVKGRSVSTANQGKPVLPLNADMGVHWVDIVDVESPRDNLRYQGAAVGAATFARGEGMLVDSSPVKGQPNSIWIMCTVGGREGLGQIFRYQPSRYEGSSREQEKPGVLSLFSEPNDAKLLQNGDNLAVMPNGDILVCEDHQGIQRLIGVNRQGEYYVLAANPRRASEFTGATFSPDGSILFVNLQQQGGTLAIRGPWHKQTKS